MKHESIVLILILVVAFAGVWFLFKGPGLAIQPVVRSEGLSEQVGDVLIRVPPTAGVAECGASCQEGDDCQIGTQWGKCDKNCKCTKSAAVAPKTIVPTKPSAATAPGASLAKDQLPCESGCHAGDLCRTGGKDGTCDSSCKCVPLSASPTDKRACVCYSPSVQREQVFQVGKMASIYDCRSMCVANDLQFVALLQ